MLKTRDFARREEGDVRFGGYLPCTMVREIFFAVAIDLLDPHLDRIADAHHVARVLDEAVGQLGDVYEAVLVHADVDERAKVDDVAHRALELHAGFQVIDGKRRAAKDHLRARRRAGRGRAF